MSSTGLDASSVRMGSAPKNMGFGDLLFILLNPIFHAFDRATKLSVGSSAAERSDVCSTCSSIGKG